MPRPRLTIEQLLAWADAHHRRTGEWPKATSGRIWGTSNETWRGVNGALYSGFRGLPGGSSLAQLLQTHRSIRNRGNLPCLEIAQILVWADAFHRCTGRWPKKNSGPIKQSPGDTWSAVHAALSCGARGLPKGSSLSKLLVKHRKAGKLSIRQILAWADQHHRRSGKWPKRLSGKIEGTVHETWSGVDQALRAGLRGLNAGSSLARLLARRRGVRNTHALPVLNVAQVLRWCDAHRRRTGKWPTTHGGVIPRSGGETWGSIRTALRYGRRGLPQTTLANLLREHRSV
jgi:hypothetical protein